MNDENQTQDNLLAVNPMIEAERVTEQIYDRSRKLIDTKMDTANYAMRNPALVISTMQIMYSEYLALVENLSTNVDIDDPLSCKPVNAMDLKNALANNKSRRKTSTK